MHSSKFMIGKALIRRASRLVAKTTLTVFYIANNLLAKESVTGRADAVVSLTTYGRRTSSVYLTIESIAFGKIKPSRLILWIDEQEVLADLPTQLKRLVKRGLEIRFCENYGPHKKYFPYVISMSDSHSVPLVTADDDMFYPKSWLQNLETAYKSSETPHIVAHRARRLKIEHNPDPKIASYSSWPLASSVEPSYAIFSTGTGGVMYPPTMLDELRERGDAFLESCRNADDLWLHSTALSVGIKTRQVSSRPADYLMIFGSQEEALFKSNHGSNGNDSMIGILYDDQLVDKLIDESSS
ncbi:hypothetical protein ACTXPA_13460 [Glutamicibacter arilaitensis]|uniref:hypothetical protein n=1 Tax=Glutamicibacter arilaitensis TaxID=256701 RepID=UPI003FCEEB23